MRSAAPKFSSQAHIAIFTSRGKSFVLRKCVSGLRLLTRQAAFVLSDVIAMARRVVTAGTNNSECRNAHPQDESFFLLGPENDGVMSSIDT